MPFTPTDYLPYDFANRRHIGPSPSEMEEMFKVLEVESIDQLINTVSYTHLTLPTTSMV